MTSDEVEAAVAAYLAAGADGDAAGGCRYCGDCPVTQAFAVTGQWVSTQKLYLWRRTSGDTERVRHTPTVQAFVALVDAEAGPTVTFAVARQLWEQAKGAG